MSTLPAEHIASMIQVDHGTYWWYAVRRGWLSRAVDQARRTFGAVRLADFGCGSGGLLQSLTEAHQLESALGLDSDARMVAIARSRGLPVELVDPARALELAFSPNLWVCADVLEHLEDDRAALESMRSASAPGALLAITVPAHAWLFSDWDVQNGHRRRYDKCGLFDVVTAAGWWVEELSYFFSFLVPAAVWTRLLSRRKRGLEFPRVPPWLNGLLAVAGRLERAVPWSPVGTSLFCLARRASSPGARAVLWA